MYHLEIFFKDELRSLIKENPANIKTCRTSLKDLIEGMGIPHTEIGEIYFDGKTVNIDTIVEKDGRVVLSPSKNPLLLEEAKFILDVHLGTLARYLRMMGFYTLYDNSYEDDKIVHMALSHDMVILTRDRGILKRKCVKKGYLIRNDEPAIQLHEVLRRYGLYDKTAPLTRCFKCNGKIIPISKKDVVDRIPEKSREAFHEFFICENCNMIYWKGSHYERFKHLIDEVKNFRDYTKKN